MFGKSKKRGALIKELVEQRLESRGVNSIDSRLKVKSLGMLAVMSMPEATMVVILEGVVKAQSRGIPLGQELIRVEQQRARQGHDSSAFARIIEKAKGSDPAEAMVDYLYYRNQLEASAEGQLSWDEVAGMIRTAYMEIRSW